MLELQARKRELAGVMFEHTRLGDGRQIRNDVRLRDQDLLLHDPMRECTGICEMLF